MADEPLEKLRDLNWSAGSVFAKEAYPAIRQYLAHPGQDSQAPIGEDEWLVVISQTCDIVAKKLQQEPFVEVLRCRPIVAPRRQFANLRSTRTLDFRPNPEHHPSIVLTAHATADRYLIPRQLLLESMPDGNRRLTATAITRIQRWYALRSTRPSWPDDFVTRIKAADGDLKSALTPQCDYIAEIRVAFTAKNDGYRVLVYFVVDEEHWSDVEGVRVPVQSAFMAFVSALKKCKGIEVDELSAVVSGDNFSWQQGAVSEAWNFDHLSSAD